MITTKLVTPDSVIHESHITGYENLQDAERALSQDWPITSFTAHNVTVLADYDGCRLILQRA